MRQAGRVSLRNVGLSYPIFGGAGTSIRSRVLEVATGGRIGKSPHGMIQVEGLRDISLDLMDGDRLGVMGANGAGKSTLLRVIAGIFQPRVGTARITGRVVSLLDVALGMYPEATGMENIAIRGRLLGMSHKQIRAARDEIVEFAGLGNFIDLPFRTYSTGMQLRLGFAVSTSFPADVVVMDEWLSVGDSEFTRRAERRLAEFVDNSSILVLASHSKLLLERVCNRGLILRNGSGVMEPEIRRATEEYF